MFYFSPPKTNNKRGSRDDAVVRTLTSQQCGPGSIPGHHKCIELIVSLLSCERFFSRYSGFSLSQKKPRFDVI